MSDDEDHFMSDHTTIQILKHGFHLFTLVVMVYVIIFTNEVPLENRKYMLFFAFMCWLSMLISTKALEFMAEEEDRPQEGVFDYTFKLTVSTFAFIFIGVILAIKLKGGDLMSEGSTGISTRGFNDLVGGSNSVSIEINKVEAAATVMGGIGVISMLMNTFSHIYMYHQCPEFDEEDTLVEALISAQYHVVVIGIIGLSIFAMFKKRG
tara:strand:+ start:277 stop:900 length:624 start_codon:yes stop_codon:yes gene_type:complete